MMDQALALDWVRDHIRDFGGNPDEITGNFFMEGTKTDIFHILL